MTTCKVYSYLSEANRAFIYLAIYTGNIIKSAKIKCISVFNYVRNNVYT